MRKSVILWTLAVALLALFVAFTVIVKTVDVQPIGPENSVVGLAGLNGPVSDFLGYNEAFYKISDICGYLAILTVFLFALVGLTQLIRGGLKGVNYRIWLLGCFYGTVGACYVLFNTLVINYRPVILDEGLEASYPSSHTLLSISCMGAAIMQARYLLKKRPALRKAAVAASVVLMVAIVGMRFASGAHWLTDILGSLLLAGALLAFYAAAVKTVSKKIRRAKKARCAQKHG